MKKIFAILSLIFGIDALASNIPERIFVSENHRYLVDEAGNPFFYLADTAWELFHRLNREETDMYLKNRAERGYTAIQAVAVAELDGINTPNAYGHLPFLNEDPTQPALNEGLNNDYWVMSIMLCTKPTH